MESVQVANAISGRRLEVFRAIYSPTAASGSVSRHVGFEGVAPTCGEEELLAMVSRYGPVQCLDLQDLAYGRGIVSYYDLRHSTAALQGLSECWDCGYLPSLPYPEYTDFLVFQDYGSHSVEDVVATMEEFGEVRGYMASGSLICIQFYDTRARSKAYLELMKLAWLDHYEDIIDLEELAFREVTRKTELCIVTVMENRSDSTTSSPGSSPDTPADSKPDLETSANPSFSISLDDILASKDLRTSVMIKNIPNKYSQHLLLEAIDKDFHGKYDFFYLPIDFKNKCNVGYAFLNFLSPLGIIQFHALFSERKWELFNSSKVCEVTYGRIQGRSALIRHFQASSVMSHEDARVKPVILPLFSKSL